MTLLMFTLLPLLPLAVATLLLPLLVVRSSYSSAASSSAITYRIDCIGMGRLDIIKALSLYLHCWLSSVVSDLRIAARPRRLRRAGTPTFIIFDC